MRIVNGHPVMLQAHRGVSTDCPENTMAAFKASVEQGYDVIELDPKFTIDNVCVVLHDRTLKRTGRNAAGEAEELAIKEITLEEARKFEYGSWFAPEFKGEQIPLLADVLDFAKANNIPLKIDNVIESFTPEQTEILFDIVEKADLGALAGFTALNPEYLAAVAKRFPECVIHYDGPTDEEALKKVCDLTAGHPLIVWLPYPNKLTSWCKTPPVSVERAQMIRDVGAKIGVWIIEDEADLVDACARFAPDVIETTGSIKPDSVR